MIKLFTILLCGACILPCKPAPATEKKDNQALHVLPVDIIRSNLIITIQL